MADDILRQAVQGISELILTPGLINLDFSDVKAAISGMGIALIGNAVATGSNAAVEAARAAINSPLLEDTKIKGARQVLMNITASPDIGLHELNEACSIIREASGSDDLQLNFGVIAAGDGRFGESDGDRHGFREGGGAAPSRFSRLVRGAISSWSGRRRPRATPPIPEAPLRSRNPLLRRRFMKTTWMFRPTCARGNY